MKRIIGLAPSELEKNVFLSRLLKERDRIRNALVNFVPAKKTKPKKTKASKTSKGASKKATQTLMDILKAKGLTLAEAIQAVKQETITPKK